jgi:hypothetical protein
MTQISTEIAAVMTMAHQLIPLIADLPVESIAQLCNVSIKQATTLKGITALGHTIIHALNQSFVGLRQVLSCSTMNPIYTIFVHQALCEEAVAGMSWIFFTTLFLAIFSMLLLMFRAALYPISDFALPASSSDEDGIEVVKKCNEQPQHAPDEVVENDNACAVNAENNLPPNANVTTQSDASAHVDAPAQDDSAHPESNGEIGRVDDAK